MYIQNYFNKNLINFSNLRIGKYGLEKFFDNNLRGKFGRRREEVNARGKIITSNLYEKPTPGKNLNLSIDLNIQSKEGKGKYDELGR